jgi:hypothetical protein
VTLVGPSGPQLMSINRREAIGLGAILLLAIASGVSWPILRGSWGLHNDLHLGPGSLPLIAWRLHDAEAVRMILHSTLKSNHLIYGGIIGLSAIGLSLLLRTGRLVEPLFCTSSGMLYLWEST